MSAERLREAAALMRSRAREATPSPWSWEQITGRFAAWEGLVRTQHPHYEEQANEVAQTLDGHDAAYVASWHPAVALAVADWLDHVAALYHGARDGLADHPALAVANAYLGATP